MAHRQRQEFEISRHINQIRQKVYQGGTRLPGQRADVNLSPNDLKMALLDAGGVTGYHAEQHHRLQEPTKHHNDSVRSSRASVPRQQTTGTCVKLPGCSPYHRKRALRRGFSPISGDKSGRKQARCTPGSRQDQSVHLRFFFSSNHTFFITR
ncbi:hypothetical protein RRG08_059332 [Elysia crispata]|uniref:Uncharacterized protein n=1 Tax=Elysia crispata TaxID=231223 RepID=A0AAE1EF64_9GAST|nr:hypothetical protein RRG08_059332 [Elysia crispata]